MLTNEQLDALIPSAVARVGACLQPTDLRRLSVEKLLKSPELLPIERKRAALNQALEIGYDATDQQHSRVRGFRNILIKVAIVIALFVGALVFIVSQFPDTVPMCFTPSVTSEEAAQTGPSTADLVRVVCPSGEDAAPVAFPARRSPSSYDMAIVGGLGLLGGALAAAFAIRKVRGTSIPYDVPLPVAFLNVPTGALTAVTGMLLLGGGFVPGLSELHSQRQILAYALLFGYSQQLGTQFIDRQAQDLINAVPSKDLKGKQADHSAQEPPDLSPATSAKNPVSPADTSEPSPGTRRKHARQRQLGDARR